MLIRRIDMVVYPHGGILWSNEDKWIRAPCVNMEDSGL